MKRIRTIADAICLIMIIGYAVFVGTSEKIGEKTKMYIPWKGSEILFGNKIIFLSSAMIAIVLWGVLSLVLFYNMSGERKLEKNEDDQEKLFSAIYKILSLMKILLVYISLYLGVYGIFSIPLWGVWIGLLLPGIIAISDIIR